MTPSCSILACKDRRMNRHARLAAPVLALGVLAALATATQQAPAKKAVPAAADQAKAEERLKAKHQAAYTKALKDPAARLALAELLLQARDLKDDADRFVYLRQACDLAARSADLPLAVQAIDELGRIYVVDVAALRAEALATAVAAVPSPEAARTVVDGGLALADEAVEADHYEQAARLARSAEAAARKTKDLPLILTVQKYQRGVEAARQQFARLQPLADRLRKDPDDPEANLEVGKYLSLLKGEWQRGLFLLAQGNDPALRRLAQRDLAQPDTTAERIEMGDAWWQQADKEKDQARVYLRQRAVYWYEQALAGADDLVRGRLEERIAAVPRPRLRALGWDYAGPPRLLHLLRGHNNGVFAVAFTADGRKVLSGSQDAQSIVWDAAGKELLTLQGHNGMIWSVACDPKGRALFTASWDGTVKMWDAKTGKEVRHFPAQGRINNINGLAVSPDGKHLLTGSDDSVVRLWEIETGREVRQMHGHNGPVFGVAFSPDGKQALSGGSMDRAMILWDVQNGQILRRFQGLQGAIRTVAISPDGRTALSSGNNDVQLWDLKTGQEIRRFKGHTQPVHAVAFSPDGRRVLSGSADGTVRLWETATGRQLHSFTGHSSAVFSVAFSPGGGRAVSGGQDTTIRIWGLPR
jgi:outer membrane protein assembly factor BamB